MNTNGESALPPPSELNVLILAGGNISHRLPFLSPWNYSPALNPIHTRPLIFYLLEFYRSFPQCRIHVFVAATELESVRGELSMYQNDCIVHPLPETQGVNESLKMALGASPPAAETIVNLVSTIPTKMPEINEVQVAAAVPVIDFCSGIVLHENEVVFSPKSKPCKGPGNPFTGIFRVRTRDLIRAETDVADDLLWVVIRLSRITLLKYATVDWQDCGHEINYYETKSRLLSSRAFNRLSVRLDKGVLRKASQRSDKLQRECRYLKLLPKEIQVYFPRIVTHYRKEDAQSGFFEMEYYGYPSLAEYQLYWNLDAAHWSRIFKKLQDTLLEFRTFKGPLTKSSMKAMYIKKTAERTAAFRDQLQKGGMDTGWLDRETVINDVACVPLCGLWEHVVRKSTQLHRENDGCIIHGDFCFGNILYDMPTGILRFVDPRGSFGARRMGIYGDQKYDLAKLAHSAIGGYDYFVNDLFECYWQGDHFHYRLNFRKNQQLIRELCRQTILNLKYSEKDIHFIMGLQFISLSLLHSDCLARQQALYLHGLKIVNEELRHPTSP
jgi:hypothetical protein